MDGTLELMNLAYMLRLGAGVAEEVAALRPGDAAVIEQLATQALNMAVRIDQLLWAHGVSAGFC